jgi:archaellum component FlaC
MDGKAKKRLEVISKKLPQLKQQLAGAKKQMDDIEEVKKLERDIAALEAEATKLRA